MESGVQFAKIGGVEMFVHDVVELVVNGIITKAEAREALGLYSPETEDAP